MLRQTKKADQVIIVDGGSTDKTALLVERFILKHPNLPINFIRKKNVSRAQGRNIAIKKARHPVIAITDAGCELDDNWIKFITQPITSKNIDVVGGYCKSRASSILEQCIAVYTLVMRVDADSNVFLPSARSMAIKKSVWEEAGGFPQQFTRNEDYVFARTLRQMGKRFSFVKEAVVYWKPRESILAAFAMFYSFARGDGQAGILRPKVILIFLRYLIGVITLFLSVNYQSYIVLGTLCVFIFFYIVWTILKNYKYVRSLQAIVFLPALQFSSDVAVLVGTVLGVIDRIIYAKQ